jgi:hypothetical protein
VRHPELILDARTGSADWPSLRGWQRLLLTSLIVCLPVPMLAASGLAVPLPPVVYRVAVGLAERTQAVAVRLPGFEAVVAETTEPPRRGTIKLSAQELAADRSASSTPAREAVDDGVRAAREPRRPSLRGSVHEAPPTRPRLHLARAGSVSSSAATEERQGPAQPTRLGRAVAPAAVPSAEQSADAPPPAPARTAEAEQDQPAPRPSDEPKPTAIASSRSTEEPQGDTPKRAAPTSEPAPALPDTPKPRSTPASPADEVATPDPGPPRETPRVQVDTPNTGSIAVTPPEVKPSVPVEAPNAGSLPVTPPESNGSVDAPELPGELEPPSVPRLPGLPARPK